MRLSGPPPHSLRDWRENEPTPSMTNFSFTCGLRGPDAADLHRAHFVPPMETSPPRHPFAQHVLAGNQFLFGCLLNTEALDDQARGLARAVGKAFWRVAQVEQIGQRTHPRPRGEGGLVNPQPAPTLDQPAGENR